MEENINLNFYWKMLRHHIEQDGCLKTGVFVKHYLCPLPTLCQILSLYLFWLNSYGYLTFDLKGWPWLWHVMFKICSFKKVHMHNKYQLSISRSKVMTQTLNLTSDLAEWPWHYYVTTQNMRLHKIHLYTKYQLSISMWSQVMTLDL